AIAPIAVQHVVPVIGHIKVGPPVVVVVAHAYALAPALPSQAGFLGHIHEAATDVPIEHADRSAALAESFQTRTIHKENIRAAVIVVIEDGHSGSRTFQNIVLSLHTGVDHGAGEAPLGSRLFVENDWRIRAREIRDAGSCSD